MLRFTLRELVLAMNLVAMGAAWAVDHWRLQSKLQNAVARLEGCEWDRSANARVNFELLSKLDRYVPDWKTRQ